MELCFFGRQRFLKWLKQAEPLPKSESLDKFTLYQNVLVVERVAQVSTVAESFAETMSSRSPRLSTTMEPHPKTSIVPEILELLYSLGTNHLGDFCCANS